ncbi:MAG: hypothetical protein Q9203_006101 [Teloschistes exilis]
MSPPERVISHEKDEDACPYHAAPVHVARRRVRGGREELKDPEHREEAQRDDVDRVSGLAKVEARSWEGFAAESFVEDALQKFLSMAMGQKHPPKHDDKCEEAEDMDESHEAFNDGQFPEEGCVGKDSQEQDSPRKQGSLPLTRLITFVAEIDQGSDLLCRRLDGSTQTQSCE